MSLIIVESPTKARTFNRILKDEDYYVFATIGHIRDLPKAKIGIDYAKQFKPAYEVIKQKEKVVAKLKELAGKNKEIILATDLDREGESISYHVAYLLGFINEKWPEISFKDTKIKRIVFHEITTNALREALKNPQELRLDLVHAQQARRILDRVVGYELSPLLWKKTGKNWLSAGRVQTVALRFIVEREKEIRAFAKEPYYQVFGMFKNGEEVRAKLTSKNDEPYEKSFTIKLFAGDYTFTKTTISKDNIQSLSEDLKGDSYEVSEIAEDTVTRHPPPPFTTSLLQQEAFRQLRISSAQVMRLAQNLYEQGLITYHRTDSFALSTGFVFKARDYIVATYGKEYSLEKPRGFKTRSRSAQEAHEAIRPTKVDKSPKEAMEGRKLTPAHKKLYELIFNRAVATQMKEAQIKTIKLKIKGQKGYLFVAESQKVLFDGFLRILNPEFVARNAKDPLNKQGEKLKLINLEEKEMETQPPYRYHDASLIKELEEKGIGRPSTYAMILSLIQTKGYVEREMRYFKPTSLGEAICDYLVGGFPQVFDVNFTAQMEEGLDKIAHGEEKTVQLLSTFFEPFSKTLEVQKTDTQQVEVEEKDLGVCPEDGGKLIEKRSKFGKFIACSNYPKCRYTKSEVKTVAGKTCPKDGGDIVMRFTRSKKRFFGCANYPKCDFAAWTWAQLT